MRRSALEIDGNVWIEIIIRAILSVTFLYLEDASPFIRKIQPEEVWLYRYPRTDSYVPSSVLWPMVIISPTLVILVLYLIRKDRIDTCQAVLALTLGLSFNGVITDIIKLIVGRPRPDFFWRCFPDGHSNPEMECTGDEATVLQGRKSFPSGHSSFSFASLGFISFYLAGKLQVFSPRGQKNAWKFSLFVLPIMVALCVALSRTCDYHHHWQDVCCGSVLGLSIAYVCYRQYYPRLTSPHCHCSYAAISPFTDLQTVYTNNHHSDVAQGLNEEQVKWI